MHDKIQLDHIGGWPKILQEAPVPPHDIFSPEEYDDTDIPHHIEISESRNFRESNNIYAAFTVISEFHKLQLYPPRWAIDRLVEGLDKHLANPDPEELARQMCVSGRTSGSANPYKEYCLYRDRRVALGDIVVLTGYFGLSFTEAARAVVEKHNLGITAKRLMNMFREDYGDFRGAMIELHRDNTYDPFMLLRECGVDPEKEFIAKFPRRTQNIIKKKTPAKT